MSERELAERLGVSRTALRAAITQLVSTHVLESRQGSGTYVLPPKPINIFQEIYNFSDAVRRAGREPGSHLVYARLIEADEDLAERTDRAQEGILWYIKREGLKGGDRLMPERALAERLGVSRTALRAAITQLVSTHVLESRQGSGTYVLPPKPINIFQVIYNCSDAVRRAGREPGSHLVYARLIEADEDLAERIQLPVGARLFEMRRIRFADDEPVAIETAYVNYSICPGIETHDFATESLYDVLGESLFEMRRIRFADDEPVAIETAYVNYSICPGIETHDFATESLYDVLGESYDVHVGHGRERISIARATAEEALLLQVEEGSPVFFERALERQADGVPVEYLKAVILPSRYRFAFERALERQADGVPVEYLKAVILPSRYRFASNGCENGSRPKGVKSSWLTW